MLKVENISSGYGKKQVLFNVSLEVNADEVVLLTGGNGSGKSTLLKCIFSILPLWAGSIHFNGEKIDGFKPFDMINKGIVYVPQRGFYFEHLSIVENLEISGATIPKKELESRIAEILDIIELSSFEKRKPFNLSGGERKILAFGMALIHKPKVLLFDEPFAGVDAKKAAVLINLFKKSIINTVNGVIVVEHKDVSRELFTRKVIMELGKIKT